LCTVDDSVKGVDSIQLFMERQLESGLIPIQVDR